MSGSKSQEAAMFMLIDQLVEMGALPDVRHKTTGRRDHQAIVMGLLALRPSVLR